MLKGSLKVRTMEGIKVERDNTSDLLRLQVQVVKGNSKTFELFLSCLKAKGDAKAGPR